MSSDCGEVAHALMTESPSLLVTGTTGSGKTSFVRMCVAELMLEHGPQVVRFAIYDSSRVGYACLLGSPHLFCPIVHDRDRFEGLAHLVAAESDRRLQVIARDAGAGLGHLVVIVDDLVAAEPTALVLADLERTLRTARLARIHVVIVTSTPSSRYLTTVLLSNIDTRVSFRVTSRAESVRVLGCPDANDLGLPGEVVMREGGSYARRKAAYLDEGRIADIVQKAAARYGDSEPPFQASLELVEGSFPEDDPASAGDDPLLREAARIVVNKRLGSTSGLQRVLKIGYRRAGLLMDALEARGIVGPPNGSAPRDVLVDSLGDEWAPR